MKKILLVIVIVFCLFQMVVLAIDIDIGSAAIDRGEALAANYTFIDKNNPANASGIITSVEIWANDALSNCEVATFYVVSGNKLSTRDYETIGTVAAGSKQTFPVDLDVEEGDYIGITYSAGSLDEDSFGVGRWYLSGDNIPCSDHFFSEASVRTISLYGTGVTLLPAQVTGVLATDGTYTDKVIVTWDAADGADKYYVWQGSSWIDVGNVLTWNDTNAPAPTITPGTASASDGTSSDYVTCSVSGESANNGSSISYKVKAWNTYGYGAESDPDSGYRGVGTLTYQWQRSAGDSDADFSNIDGATTDPYNDTGAPADGSGRYYRCVEDAIGAVQQISTSDRGYRLSVANSFFFGTNF